MRKSVASKAAFFQQKAEKNVQKQKENPFSSQFNSSIQRKEIISKDDPRYGRPEEGSKSDLRSKQANQMINKEIIELCEVIEQIGTRQHDGQVHVKFGPLFETYTRISNKLVGMLLRARKQKMLTFTGETLFQRRDDDVVISLLISSAELVRNLRDESGPSQQPFS